MELNDLSAALWRQRQLLELLVFKLGQQQDVLTSGDTRWVAQAAVEVGDVVDRLRAAELGRAVEAEAAATSLGLPDGDSLLALASHAPSPWDALLRDHHQALVTLTQQAARLMATTRECLVQTQQSVEEELLHVAVSRAEPVAGGVVRNAR